MARMNSRQVVNLDHRLFSSLPPQHTLFFPLGGYFRFDHVGYVHDVTSTGTHGNQ